MKSALLLEQIDLLIKSSVPDPLCGAECFYCNENTMAEAEAAIAPFRRISRPLQILQRNLVPDNTIVGVNSSQQVCLVIAPEHNRENQEPK